MLRLPSPMTRMYTCGRTTPKDTIFAVTTCSWLLGYLVHCSRCPQCLKRRDAFRAAGHDEPTGFYRA